MNRLRLRVSDR
jgi:hypothetical protein